MQSPPEFFWVARARLMARRCARRVAFGLRPWVVALLLVFPAGRAVALDPLKAISQFSHRSWGIASGINQVNAICQTQDGYLWVACDNGLFRFDGASFVPWEPLPGEPGLPVVPHALLPGTDGSLWVGGLGGITWLHDGHSRAFPVRNPEERAWVNAFGRTSDGSIWAGTSLGLYRFTGEQWEPASADLGLPAARVQALLLDRSDVWWLTLEDTTHRGHGAVAFRRPGERRFEMADTNALTSAMLAQAPDGKIWGAQTMRSVRPFVPGAGHIEWTFPEIHVGSQAIAFDRDGSFWIATLGDGLRRVRDTAQLSQHDIGQFSDDVDKFTQKDGLSSDYVRCLFEDREGVIWCGTSAGLDAFSESKITSLSMREGVPFDQNLCLQAAPDGTVWAGATPRGLMQIKPGAREFQDRAWLDLKSGKGGTLNLYTLYADPGGALFAGTGLGVAVCTNANGPMQLLDEVPDLQTVIAITRDGAGGVWLCDRYAGVFRLHSGIVQKFPELHREADGWVSVAFTDPAGQVWLGLTTGEVARYVDGRFQIFSARDGLFTGPVTAIATNAAGQLWVAGKGGLSGFEQNHFQTLDRRRGLPFDDIYALLPDDEGCFWLAGPGGLFRVATRDLSAALADPAVRITGETLSLSDGLRGQVRHIPVGVRGIGCNVATKSTDGRLWFATTAGLAVVDPRHIPRNQLPPPVRIQQLIVGGVGHTAFAGLTLPVGSRDCEIDYAALSFNNPAKVHYRYRLEGSDAGWVDAGTRRQAFYSNLRPGAYQFRVTADNGDGVWNETGDAVDFKILPAFYQTGWFMALGIGVSLTMLAGGYGWRVRQLKARQAVLQKARDQLAAANLSLTSEVEERQRAESRLRRSEDYLAQAQKLSRSGSFGWNIATGELVWSAETFCILGYAASAKPALSLVFDRVHPDDLPFVRAQLEQAAGDRSALDLEHRLLLPDGRIKHVHVVARPTHADSGDVEFVGAVMDITERKQAAEALRASEHLARGQVEALTSTLSALSRESEPEQLLAHVLQTMGSQLRAHSLGVYELDETPGQVQLVAFSEHGRLRLATPGETQASLQFDLAVTKHPVWTEFFTTGAHCVIGDIQPSQFRVRFAEAPEACWHDWSFATAANPTAETIMKRLRTAGIVCTLAVPTMLAGKVAGLISIRFAERREFLSEEIALTRALTHQAMLAVRLLRLSRQSREAAVAAERNRMARDIHDTLAQGFTGVIMQLEAAKGAMTGADGPAVTAHLERAEALARASLGEARRSVRAMRSRSLLDGTLSTALDDLLKRMTSGTDLQAELVVQGAGRSLPPEWEEGLLRIAQESLTNTIKYAQARRFGATLTFAADTVRLQLVDDGRGFNPQAEHDGFGLVGMRERAEQLAGRFVLRSMPGQGTEILVELKPADAADRNHENDQV